MTRIEPGSPTVSEPCTSAVTAKSTSGVTGVGSESELFVKLLSVKLPIETFAYNVSSPSYLSGAMPVTMMSGSVAPAATGPSRVQVRPNVPTQIHPVPTALLPVSGDVRPTVTVPAASPAPTFCTLMRYSPSSPCTNVAPPSDTTTARSGGASGVDRVVLLFGVVAPPGLTDADAPT